LSDVGGIEGGDPAGYIFPVSTGLHILGYYSNPFPIVVEAATFERYLTEEGLDSIALIRQRQGTTGVPGREKFSRSAKALIEVGTGEDRISSEPLNFRIEIIPELESFPLVVDERLAVQLRFEGDPLVGSLVSAFSRKDPLEKQMGRTDKYGRFSIHLDKPGPWLVKSVHMIPGEGTTDWESFWASLTFEVRPK